MNLLVQDVVATSLAIGAVALIVRRVLGVLTPSAQTPGCAGCPSCPTAAAATPDRAPEPDAAPRPIVLIRSRKSA
jgi:hypothetical protein